MTHRLLEDAIALTVLVVDGGVDLGLRGFRLDDLDLTLHALAMLLPTLLLHALIALNRLHEAVLHRADLRSAHIRVRVARRTLGRIGFEALDARLEPIGQAARLVGQSCKLAGDGGVILLVGDCTELAIVQVVDARDAIVQLSRRRLDLIDLPEEGLLIIDVLSTARRLRIGHVVRGWLVRTRARLLYRRAVSLRRLRIARLLIARLLVLLRRSVLRLRRSLLAAESSQTITSHLP